MCVCEILEINEKREIFIKCHLVIFPFQDLSSALFDKTDGHL